METAAARAGDNSSPARTWIRQQRGAQLLDVAQQERDAVLDHACAPPVKKRGARIVRERRARAGARQACARARKRERARVSKRERKRNERERERKPHDRRARELKRKRRERERQSVSPSRPSSSCEKKHGLMSLLDTRYTCWSGHRTEAAARTRARGATDKRTPESAASKPADGRGGGAHARQRARGSCARWRTRRRPLRPRAPAGPC